jgi:ankyrin repeat protein
MSFTTKLLKGVVLSDIVRIVDRYLVPKYALVPKNANFKQLCSIGLYEHIMDYCLHITPNFNDGLLYASEYGHSDIVNLMINKGAITLNMAFYIACLCGHFEVVSLIINKGEINWKYGYSCSNITNQISDTLDNAEKLWEYGFTIWDYGLTIWDHGLILACNKTLFNSVDDRLKIINTMIKKGADTWNHGFIIACANGSLEIVKLLIDKANNYNQGFIVACQYGHLEIVKLMIKKVANRLNTGLHTACIAGHLEIVNLMIEKGANKCVCNNHIFPQIL